MNLYFLVSIIIPYCLLSGLDIQALSDDAYYFKHAQILQQNNEIQKAIEEYKKIKHKNVVVLENIATCYAQEQQYAYALLFYKKACQVATNSHINRLLDRQEDIYKKISGIDSDSASRTMNLMIQKTLLYIPNIIFHMCIAIIFIVMLLVEIGAIHFSSRRKMIRFIVILSFVLLIFIGLLNYKNRYIIPTDHAIVVQNNVVVYAGPEKTFHNIACLSYGSEVKVMQKMHEMYKISMGPLTGWIEMNALELINHDA